MKDELKGYSLIPKKDDKPTLPRCEENRVTKYANDTRDSDYQCSRKAVAVVKINGVDKKLCRLHLGGILADKWLRQVPYEKAK